MNKLQALLKANLMLAKLIENEANNVVSLDRKDTVDTIKGILDAVFTEDKQSYDPDYVLAKNILLAPSIRNELAAHSVLTASDFRKAVSGESGVRLSFLTIREVAAQMSIYEATISREQEDYIISATLLLPPSAHQALEIAEISTANDFRKDGIRKLNSLVYFIVESAMKKYEGVAK